VKNLFEEAQSLGISVPKSLALSVNLLNNADLPDESKDIISKSLESDDDFLKFKSSVDKAKSALAIEEAKVHVDALRLRVESSRLQVLLDDLEGTLTDFFSVPENEEVISSGNNVDLSGSFSVKWVDSQLEVTSSYEITDDIRRPITRNKSGRSDKVSINGIVCEDSRVWNVLSEIINQTKMDRNDTNKSLKTDHTQSETTYGWNNAVSMLPAHARNNIKLTNINKEMSKEEGLQLIASYTNKKLELV